MKTGEECSSYKIQRDKGYRMTWFIIKLWVSFSLEAEVSNEHQNIYYGVIRNQDDFAWFDSLCPSQQFFSYVGTSLPTIFLD